MKRIFYIIVALFCLASCSDDRRQILKVYNWGDYIDEDLIPEFEEWYEEQTGEPVTIVYQTFDINETMLSKIEKGHEDYDVVCPSDYIIERMLRADLLLPIDRDFGDTPNYIDENISPCIKNWFNQLDGHGKNANDYSVSYMWGTTGILYNTKYVDEADTHSWDIIQKEKYAGKIFVKDACRDVYSPILMHLRQDDIRSGAITREELMYDSSDESLAAVSEFMKKTKDLVAGWEADFGKEQMTQEKGWLNMTWSGDAVWAIVEGADVGVELKYTVPDEGSNYWFDGWVIPKYAQNVKAAKYFINFLCQPDVALRNMDYIGYVSAIGSPEILENIEDEEYEPVDLSYFFGPEATSVCANPAVYPDKSVIERCTLMHDWGDDSAKLVKMWSDVKGNNASFFTYFIIIATFAVLIFAVIMKRTKLSKRRRQYARRQRTKSASAKKTSKNK